MGSIYPSHLCAVSLHACVRPSVRLCVHPYVRIGLVRTLTSYRIDSEQMLTIIRQSVARKNIFCGQTRSKLVDRSNIT